MFPASESRTTVRRSASPAAWLGRLRGPVHDDRLRDRAANGGAMKTNIVNELRSHIDSAHVVRIERGDFSAYPGIPIAMSQSLLLVRSLNDLFVDGLIVFRVRDVTAVRYGDSQQFAELVVR